MKKLFFAVFIIVLLGGAYVWFFVYNKDHRDIVSETPAIETTAEPFFNEFYTQQDSAIAKYREKVVVVTGEVISKDANAVLLHPGIYCVLDSTQENTFHVGQRIMVKGRVSGFDDLLGMGEVRMDFCTEYRK